MFLEKTIGPKTVLVIGLSIRKTGKFHYIREMPGKYDFR